MNIKILDSWFREYLETNATPQEIAKSLSLCGPSVERLEKVGNDFSYDIEITSNRVDSASVYGIAKEAVAILPEFGFKARLKVTRSKKQKTSKLKSLLPIIIDPKLVNRVMAIVLEDVSMGETPNQMKIRLETAGMRSINSIVDITNYVMLETGHPTHVFDYDLIKGGKLVFRESKKGEKVTSFDGKTYSLPGGDIVIDNGKGEIIDIPGIIGTKNSVVNAKTKRILFFIDNNDPVRIRKTSMRLGIRTMAAVLNEKGVDPELASFAFEKAVGLYQTICKAKLTSQSIDIYPRPYKESVVKVSHEFIEKRLGIKIPAKRVIATLTSLGFGVKVSHDLYSVAVPSERALDVTIPEDIVEEIARIYGYHNLPSILMTGALPEKNKNNTFDLETKIKSILKSLGGIETYTLSLVSKDEAGESAIKLSNPLGSDSEYLRTSLAPSLIAAAKNNPGEKEPYFLFEIANVFLPVKNNLPEEKLTVASIFNNFSYREAKGVIEELLAELNISYKVEVSEKKSFRAGSRIEFVSNGKPFAELGVLEETEQIYFESEIEKLNKLYSTTPTFTAIPKYPAQIEDITLDIPEKTKITEVINTALETSKFVSAFELKDIYGNSYTFRVSYLDLEKTLTDKEVEALRNKIISALKTKFGITVKD